MHDIDRLSTQRNKEMILPYGKVVRGKEVSKLGEVVSRAIKLSLFRPSSSSQPYVQPGPNGKKCPRVCESEVWNLRIALIVTPNVFQTHDRKPGEGTQIPTGKTN
jgi:hypothetical protein